ncbi:hypothetical protein J2W25_006742 [Variovorax boronicumulans]|uniref:Uncharacterized protein n=1 Tax=Variovorax boronicumulans TaxID=436515 RepID=A0AAW8E716_9BURK|nr:hypothetical protein [Variovorax boronicumulans]MDP9882402.1 hypothetical protein [Variovorax boronicumulans]MDP9927688.1 hypothetical protein [Variovorax boronicumulans]
MNTPPLTPNSQSHLENGLPCAKKRPFISRTTTLGHQMWIPSSDALYEMTLRAYEKHLAKYWDDPNHEIFSWPTPTLTESPLLPSPEGLPPETFQTPHLPYKPWSQLLDGFTRIHPDGHLSGSMIKMVLRYRLSPGMRCSIRSTVTMARIEHKHVSMYSAKAKRLRLNWQMIEEVHPDTLKQVMFPAKRPHPFILPEFSEIEHRIREDRSTVHAEWFRYACANHESKTYKISCFYKLYQEWMQKQSIPTERFESA